eukprot:TRINITY_DN18192_c0_g1_i1.p1 TRINITY_DN18192_c0_g1~~TRINITY_DN18192_c0_g1_i1.p1  ORF type:complete len:396 (+),score=85.11 TRINITY_DN18192_c0_g1_i1:57-1244(+)
MEANQVEVEPQQPPASLDPTEPETAGEQATQSLQMLQLLEVVQPPEQVEVKQLPGVGETSEKVAPQPQPDTQSPLEQVEADDVVQPLEDGAQPLEEVAQPPEQVEVNEVAQHTECRDGETAESRKDVAGHTESGQDEKDVPQIPIELSLGEFICLKLDESKGFKGVFAVLLTTGSFNPIHKMHVEMFEQAKRELEQHFEIRVVVGLISPSHDQYVGSKLGSEAIPASDRIEMTKLATKDSSWIKAYTWEAEQDGFVDFPGVTYHLQDEMSRLGRERQVDLRVFYVCGTDHARKCGLNNGIRGVPEACVCAIRRPGYDIRSGEKTFVVNLPSDFSHSMADLSSTKVRKLCAGRGCTRDKLLELVHESVADYMIKNQILGVGKPSQLFARPNMFGGW